jgi:hypothetical protein
MVTKKSWQEFRDTGLFMFVNTILHAFGWALVVDLNEEKEIVECYPARVKFRGFGTLHQGEMHKKIGAYLKENAEQLEKEANDE